MSDYNKTLELCNCGVISGMLNDPESSITLGQDNTFCLAGSWAVYHCPFCGGKLPDSSKPIWYPRHTESEWARLHQLVEGITTPEEAFQRLGLPDHDAFVSGYDDVDGKSVAHDALSQRTRNIDYYHLSEHANIEFYFNTVKQTGSVGIHLKFIPPRHIEDDANSV